MIALSIKQQGIAYLLLKGWENKEIAQELGMAHRTVKAHFNRMYMALGIRGGIKRVRLAVTLYKDPSWMVFTEAELQMTEKKRLLLLSLKDSKIRKLLRPLERPSMLSKTISASSSTNSACGVV